MGNRGDDITTNVPSVGDTETAGTSDILTILTELVARSEAKVGAAEINVDATLDFNTQAGENITYLEFVTQGSAPTLNETLYTKNVTRDELFYKDSSGSEVQLTADGAVNVAATGAITGAGYGSGGVALNWNSAGTNYQFKSGSGADDYAAVTCDGLQLRDGSSHKLTLDATAMSADQTLTFPADVTPTVQSLLSVDASGNMIVGAPDIASTETLTVESGGDITVASGGSITLNSFGQIIFPAVEVPIPLMLGQGTGNEASAWTFADGSARNQSTSGSVILYLPLYVRVGERIDDASVHVLTNAAGDTVTLGIYSRTTTGTETIIGSSVNTMSTGLLTLANIDTTVVTDTTYFLRVNFTGSGSTDVVLSHADYLLSQQ